MATKKPREADPHGFRREGQDLLRAVAGGSIFGMPLLYTMEMWQQGMIYSSRHHLVFFVVILVANFLFCSFYGLRTHYTKLPGVLEDAVTSIGIALALSAGVLLLIGELDPDLGFTDMAGKILFEAFVVSLGVSYVTVRFRDASEGGEGRQGLQERIEGNRSGGGKQPDDPQRLQLRADLQDMATTLGGAAIFAFSVAPTEEILRIALQLPPWRQLILLGAEVILCYIILYASGFWNQKVYVKDSLFQSPMAEVSIACALSLAVSFGLLSVVGYPGTTAGLSITVASTIVLGLPAIVGGAAGRLAG